MALAVGVEAFGDEAIAGVAVASEEAEAVEEEAGRCIVVITTAMKVTQDCPSLVSGGPAGAAAG